MLMSFKDQDAVFCILNVQKLGGNAMLVDAEHAFDPAYSKALGVDVENLIVCQPDNGEMALESNIIFLIMILFVLYFIENWAWWPWKQYGSWLVLMLMIYEDLWHFHISVADRMCRSGAVDLICVDSVSALTPRAEIEVWCYLLLFVVALE